MMQCKSRQPSPACGCHAAFRPGGLRTSALELEAALGCVRPESRGKVPTLRNEHTQPSQPARRDSDQKGSLVSDSAVREKGEENEQMTDKTRCRNPWHPWCLRVHCFTEERVHCFTEDSPREASPRRHLPQLAPRPWRAGREGGCARVWPCACASRHQRHHAGVLSRLRQLPLLIPVIICPPRAHAAGTPVTRPAACTLCKTRRDCAHARACREQAARGAWPQHRHRVSVRFVGRLCLVSQPSGRTRSSSLPMCVRAPCTTPAAAQTQAQV